MLDILMITHNRLEYLQKALPGILSQDYKDWYLTIWDNASDKRTIDWLEKIEHDRIHIQFSRENMSLASVTNRVFSQSEEEFVGKVDPDTIIPSDWASRLIDAHQKYHFGFIGGFHFKPEDLIGREPNIENFNGVKVWRKHHIGGCSFIIRREDFGIYDGSGVMGLSEYQAQMSQMNGYLWDPILWVDHMEDARSEYYINNKEYNNYKKKTRNMSLEKYQTGISNPNYLDENTKI